MTHHATGTAGVILAAGSASRFGSAKQVLSIDGAPMVRRAAITALDAGLWPVMVVIGAHANAVLESLGGLDVHLVTNPGWADGMGGSLALGARAALNHTPSLDAIMVLLADQPAILAIELDAMLEQHARHPSRMLAAYYDGHIGPPCLFPTDVFAELMSLSGPEGARDVLKRHAAMVDTYALPSAALDIDTPADHAAWLASQSPETSGNGT